MIDSTFRCLALVAATGYLVYTLAQIFLIAPGVMSLSQDMFWLTFAAVLFGLSLLVQRRDSRVGRFLHSL